MPEIDLPDKVTCQLCGATRDFLPNHLMLHKVKGEIESTQEYRELCGLDDNSPLHSRSYSEIRSEIEKQQPKRVKSSRMGIRWVAQRRDAVDRLAHFGYYTSKQITKRFGIPSPTIYSAFQHQRLSYSSVCLLIKTKGGWADTSKTEIMVVYSDDLARFQLIHQPKIRSKG